MFVSIFVETLVMILVIMAVGGGLYWITHRNKGDNTQPSDQD